MHKFNVEIRGRKLFATDPSKQDFLDRLQDDYENRKIVVQVSFEIPLKDINADQERLYRAFIVKAADHFGNEFGEMQQMLMQFWPIQPSGIMNYMERKPVSKWTSKDLDDFINKSSAHLAQFGFHF